MVLLLLHRCWQICTWLYKVLILVVFNLKFQVPKRKPSTNEKPLPKEENKLQTPQKKSSASATSPEPDKSTKQRSPSQTAKKTPEVTNTTPGNLTKFVPIRRWTDGSVSWASLPSPLIKLGKVYFQSHLYNIVCLSTNLFHILLEWGLRTCFWHLHIGLWEHIVF